MDNRVAVDRCLNYNVNEIKQILLSQLRALGIDVNQTKGKNVVIKPNLVMRASPDKSATTHPAVIEAACAILCGAGANVTIAESNGGLYNETILEGLYKTCGIADIASRLPVKLNYDTGFKTLHTGQSISSKTYNLITPVFDADYIINIAKLKTHTFMMMSAAVKNLFGTIPGIQKFEVHARFNSADTFAQYINDLTLTLCREKECFHIVDAVSGMQGNGPTGGLPLEIGGILSGVNPFALDTACMSVLNLDQSVLPMQKLASKAGLCPKSESGLDIKGVPLSELKVNGYIAPDTMIGKKFENVPDFLSPHPVINKRICVGCGECARNCPVKAIDLTTGNGKKKARIKRGSCIKCYCCQELCRFKAVKIHTNFIFKIIK